MERNTLTREEVIRGLREVPALPASVVAVLAALDDEELAIGVLQKKVATDPALSARVLRVANSPFYGMPSQISSIRDACIVLGRNTLRHITLALGVIDSFPANNGTHVRLQSFWCHSMMAAVAARELATQCNIEPEAAFTAGLLHELGKLVLDHYFAKQYAEVMAYHEAENCLLYEAECRVLGIGHGEVGALLAEQWHLPAPIVAAMRQPRWNGTCNEPLADLVAVADRMAMALELGESGESLVAELCEGQLQCLGLEVATIIDVLPRVGELAGQSDLVLCGQVSRDGSDNERLSGTVR